MAKLRGGKTISVVTLGGSITTGHQAQPPESAGWAAHVNNWLQGKASESGGGEPGGCEPDGSVEFHNSGASGTDSAFASIRVCDHALAYNPDLVIVEYAVNDQWLDSRVRRRSYEGLIRRLLDGSDRAIVLIALNEKGDPEKSAFLDQSEIARYYNIPILAWADWVKPSEWDNYFSGEETIHPNNEGHASIASGIIRFLNAAWDSPRQAASVNTAGQVLPLPPPLVSAEFQNVKFIDSSDAAAIVKNAGWEAKPAILPDEWLSRGGRRIYGWTTSDPRADLAVRVRGKSVGVLFAESDQFFNSLAWLEDAGGNAKTEKTIIKNYVDWRIGYYGFAYAEIADNLDPLKEYILRIGINPGAKNSASAHIIGIICTDNGD
jgi:lysophospholipase L1-like esterase